MTEETIIKVVLSTDAEITVEKMGVFVGDIVDVTYDGNSVVNSQKVAVVPRQSKADVGLGNVDNTSDADKPVSTAQATAIASAVAGEASLRGSADQTLQGNIDAEEAAREAADTALDNSKVDKIAGKGLSTNDYTTAEKTKLAGIETGAEVNDPLYTSTGTHTDGAMTQKATTDAISAEASARETADNGKADLVDGKVPSSQLPSYVDDVLEYANRASFPSTGESGKIYIALDTNITYRWGGSAYVAIGSSLVLGETSSTAYRGDRGKTAYDHSQVTGNPHGLVKGDIGLGNVDNTADADKPVSTPQQEALDDKVDKVTGKGLSTNDYTTAEKNKLAGIDPSVLLTTADKGTSGGVAELGSDGKVPSSQLPSYVDDVLEYATLSAFPATGESGKIYIALDTNITYRWGGSAYVVIGPSLAANDKVFKATYGTTTIAEIKTAYDAGKFVYAVHNTRVYVLSTEFLSNAPPSAYFSRVPMETSPGSDGGAISSGYICCDGNGWSSRDEYIQRTSARVTSLSASSTVWQYPSAKCVYDGLATKQKSITYGTADPSGGSNGDIYIKYEA